MALIIWSLSAYLPSVATPLERTDVVHYSSLLILIHALRWAIWSPPPVHRADCRNKKIRSNQDALLWKERYKQGMVTFPTDQQQEQWWFPEDTAEMESMQQCWIGNLMHGSEESVWFWCMKTSLLPRLCRLSVFGAAPPHWKVVGGRAQLWCMSWSRSWMTPQVESQLGNAALRRAAPTSSSVHSCDVLACTMKKSILLEFFRVQYVGVCNT